jgi:plastocyanin
MKTPHTTILAATLALTLAACADDDPVIEDPAGGEATGVDEESGDAAQEPDGGEAGEPDDGDEVLARNISFDPGTITVEAGTTVTFTNEDIVRHTVTSGEPGEPDDEFDENLPDQGDTVQITFDEPGTFVYYCDLHRNMIGEVVVE